MENPSFEVIVVSMPLPKSISRALLENLFDTFVCSCSWEKKKNSFKTVR
jgi:hypothetical protein